MAARSDTTKAYTFSADTTAVFAFFIGGVFGLFWPFILYLLVMLMRNQAIATTGQAGNNADALIQFLDDLIKKGVASVE